MKKLSLLFFITLTLFVNQVAFSCKMSPLEGSIARMKAILEKVAKDAALKENEVVQIKRKAFSENITVVLQNGKIVKYTTSISPTCKVTAMVLG